MLRVMVIHSTWLRIMLRENRSMRRDRTMSKVEGLWTPEKRVGTGAYPYIDTMIPLVKLN
jgi:hypothetical protein